VDTPISWKTAFSKTAREYYKPEPRALAEQEQPDEDRSVTTIETTDNAVTEAEDHNPTETISNPETLPDENQAQDEAKNGQAPFAHLSRAEFLKRIGIN
jgi:hypothetical protein